MYENNEQKTGVKPTVSSKQARAPRIRFKGFTDDWEQRKLGELGNIMTGSTPNTSNLDYYSDDGLPWVTPTDIESNTIFETQKKLSEEGAKAGRVVPANTLLCTCIASIGKNALLTVKGSFNQQINSLTPNHDNNPYFLLTESKLWSNQMKRMAASGTMQIVNKAEFSEIKTMVPHYDEQKKIGDYFRNLDTLITLHQRKHNKLLSLKKSMLEKMFPKNGEKVPEIRFPGFSDDWEQRKLGDLLMSLQNNTLSRADLSNESGVAKNVHYGDVLIKFGEVLDISKEQLPMITDERVLSKYKASFLQNGDVIVADTAEDSTVGKCSEIVGLNDEVVLSGLHTIPYRPVENFASGYLGYYLNSDTYHNQLIPLMQGIKVTSISKSAMQDTDIFYPKSIEEQGKISNYLQSLDHLITLHQRELDKLMMIKKSMLEKMFV